MLYLILLVIGSAVTLILVLEIQSRLLIRRLRVDFQWLITEEDEVPELDIKGLSQYIPHGFDAKIGWIRKPYTSGVDQGLTGKVDWSIDDIGARRDTEMELSPIDIIAVGDSYVFGRQVENWEAWPALLGKSLGVRVVNLGVGNYGLDQAILRYLRDGLIPGAKVAIMGVVPETISRIHSSWKHYSEYGNTFAFKPRFRLNEGNLELLNNLINSPDKFTTYRQYLPILQERDYFYKRKFRKDMIRPPYLFHWLSNPRNRSLVLLLQQRERQRASGNCTDVQEAIPFRSVMERNIKMAGDMYGQTECTDLLKEIVLLFAKEARAIGVDPVFIMFPQLMDLELFGLRQPYHEVLNQLQGHLLTIDGSTALSSADIKDLYVEDSYGGHYSQYGNKVIANLLESHVSSLLGRRNNARTN